MMLFIPLFDSIGISSPIIGSSAPSESSAILFAYLVTAALSSIDKPLIIFISSSSSPPIAFWSSPPIGSSIGGSPPISSGAPPIGFSPPISSGPIGGIGALSKSPMPSISPPIGSLLGISNFVGLSSKTSSFIFCFFLDG